MGAVEPLGVGLAAAALPERPDCAADVGGTFVRATTSEGNGVGILIIGTGTGGVVLGPQDDGDICQWLPYAKELATTYRVALFDWKEPREELAQLSVTALRRAGARKVVLGGASYGGAIAMSQAYRVRPAQVGVLSFGGELTLPGLDGRPGIRWWRGPLVQIGSNQDSFFTAKHARELRALHPGPETILMPGQRARRRPARQPAPGPGARDRHTVLGHPPALTTRGGQRRAPGSAQGLGQLGRGPQFG